MIDYQEVRIDIVPCSEAATDLLAAFLADEGFESFVPKGTGLLAYIKASDYDPGVLNRIIAGFPMDVRFYISNTYIKGKDWNEEWEKNYFHPITIGDQVVIHSSFQKDLPQARYDIVIDPKMAFGTGHHQTTSLILEYLLSMPIEGKKVIDMGTGTGILSILCSMRGAKEAVGIEIDPGACENARENVGLNRAERVKIHLGDARLLAECEPADLFIANINRNIILADFDAYASALKPGGDMLLSGFYTEDIPLILARALPLGLSEADRRTRDNWAVLHLRKQE